MSVRFGRHKVGKALPCFELIYARSGIQSFSAKDRLVEQYQKMIGCPNGHKLVQTPDSKHTGKSNPIGEDRVELGQSKLAELYHIVEKRPKTAYSEKIQKMTTRILPKTFDSLPTLTRFQTLKFLPADTEEEITASLKIIRQEMERASKETRKPVNLKLLTDWINQQEVPLLDLDLDKAEIQQLAPFLKYMNLIVPRYHASWTEEEICALIASASSSLNFTGN